MFLKNGWKSTYSPIVKQLLMPSRKAEWACALDLYYKVAWLQFQSQVFEDSPNIWKKDFLAEKVPF
jgi:hypothetical protein